jgi:hypothetical protein
MKTAIRFALVITLLPGIAETALAGQHSWDVNEVFSNATGTIQFVELREADGLANETGVPAQSISATNTGESFIIGGGPLSTPTTNKFFLLATASFAALSGAPTPDALIPGGSIPFFSNSGDTVTYSVYDNWAFGAVPTNGVDSLHRTGTSPAANSPTNYAGQTGQVNAGGPAASVPALGGLGIGLVVGLLVLAGLAITMRSRGAPAV